MIDKETIIKEYKDSTNSTTLDVSLVLELATKFATSPNYIRMVLRDANIFDEEKPKPTIARTSKAKEQENLKSAILDLGHELTEDETKMIDRMTGKSCAFFNRILSNAKANTD